ARPLMTGSGLDYNPSFSADGKWVLFTSERDGSADLYRVRADGSGVERLTDDPSYDDQGALSPDGREVAFVSTRGGGKAHIWVLDVASRRCRKVTEGAGGEFRPMSSPDGDRNALISVSVAMPGHRVPLGHKLYAEAV